MAGLIIKLPEAYSEATEGLLAIGHEEEALCWVWALPELFPWKPHGKAHVIWLYSQPVGAGDLWGVDSDGDLLVVECKQCQRCDDPFASFINPHDIHRSKLLASHWRDNFPRYLTAELSVSDCCAPRSKGKTLGVLPRSNQRAHIRRWPLLSQMMSAQIQSPEYLKLAFSYLEIRQRKNNPLPYYLGLMVQTRVGRTILDEKAMFSAHKLQSEIDVEHVKLIVISATVTRERTLLLNAEWRVLSG